MDILEYSMTKAGEDGHSKDARVRLANKEPDLHVGALGSSLNEYLTSIGVVVALILTIAFPGITQPFPIKFVQSSDHHVRSHGGGPRRAPRARVAKRTRVSVCALVPQVAHGAHKQPCDSESELLGIPRL